MKKSNNLLASMLLILFLIATSVYSGDKEISKIRKRYNSVKQLHSDERFEHHVTLNTIHAAIGLQTTKIRFLHSSWQSDPEKSPYLTETKLNMVIVTYNISASVIYTIEYLFDKEERLIFYFWQEVIQNEDSNSKEKRYYFQNGKLIKVILDECTRNNVQNDKSVVRRNNFVKEDKDYSELIKSRAAEYKKLFENLETAEKLK